MIKIYHNPRCGKSRNALKAIENKQVEFEIIKYLECGLDMKSVLKLFQKSPQNFQLFVRKQEVEYKENVKKMPLSAEEVAQVLVKYPKLLQRPVLESANFALICRDEKSIKEFLDKSQQ